MVVLAAEALPRGGRVAVRPMGNGVSGLEVAAAGEALNVSPELREALGPGAAVDGLTSRTIHGYFTARLAEGMGAALTILTRSPGELAFHASAG
jgi:histidine phosphotransferase ChpT